MRLFSVFFVLLVLSASTKVYAQNANCPPPNIGFEEGTFNHWECDTGKIDRNGVLHLTPTLKPVPYRQTIIDKNTSPATDMYGGFPVLCPNGSGHSILLGTAEEDAFSLAESVSYTLTVPATANDYNLIFTYALVLLSPGYANNLEPRFTVRAYDVTDGVYIDCASYSIIALPGQPGWKLYYANVPQGYRIYTHDWTTAAVNLNGYAGKQIRLEFITNHAAIGGVEYTAFGYAYIDVNEDCAQPITGNSYCNGQNSITLTAPPGFGAYEWYNADFSAKLGNKSQLTISPAPPDQTKYALIKYTSNGFYCPDTLYTVVSKVAAGFTFKVKDTVYTCDKTPVDLTAASVTAGSSNDLTFGYYSDPGALTYLYHPQTINQNGTYYIKAVNKEGCSNTLPVTVIVVNSQVLSVTDPLPVVYPATVDISATFEHNSNFSYGYYTNSAATDAVTDFQHISVSGTYYIKATNTLGCSTIAPVKVTVSAPASSQVETVNVFTPNNDGINDQFSVKLNAFTLFRSLKIFNRYGVVVFETTSPNVYWDGNVNGQPAGTGTYYWLLEGVNAYSNSRFLQSGFVALLR